MSDLKDNEDGVLVNDTLREIMKNSVDYMFVKNIHLVYCGGSEIFAKAVGFSSASEYVGKTDFDIFPKEFADKYHIDDCKVLESGKPIVGIIERLPDMEGKQRWIRTWKRPLHDNNGNIIGLYGISRDISSEMVTQKRAGNIEDHIGLISRIPCGVAILHQQNEEFLIDFANDGFLEVHHHKKVPVESFIGSDIMKYVYNDDRNELMKQFGRIKFIDGISESFNYRVIGNDGILHWVTVRLCTAYKNDDIQYYYAAYGSLDTQKEIEEKLEQSRDSLEESILNADLQFFTYYPGSSRCENIVLNERFSQLPKVWKNYPDDFLEYTSASPEDAKAYRKMVSEIDNGADEAKCTVRFSNRNKFIWEKITMRAVRDSNGRTIRVQGHSVDVTKKINAAKRLRQERVRLKTLENGVFETFSFNITKLTRPDVQTKDEQMLKMKVSTEIMNQALHICPALSHTNPETLDVLLKAASRIPDAKDRELFIATCSGNPMRSAVKEGQYNPEIRYRRYVNNTIRWVMTTAEILLDPDSGDLIAFYYTKDIDTDVTRELLIKNIIEKNYACVSCWDLRSDVFTVFSGTDRELLSLSGKKYCDAISESANEFVMEQDCDEYLCSLEPETIKNALAKNKFYTVYNRRRSTASELPGNPHRRMKNDIFYLDGHNDIIVFLLSDVTGIFEQERESRQRLETALLAANQASSAKSNFLSRMSHEIRTPLNAIIGMDTIAAQSINNPEKAADCVAKIGLSARYLLSLINDILDMSRIESGKMLLKNASFPFPEFISGINNIIYPQIRSKGVDYECIVSNEICDSYIGDEMKLQQILVNILGNAVKFTCKGKISLDISVLSREQKKEKIRFVVSDTGCGIAEANLKRIFEAFEQVDTSTTTVFGGTGLGLAITKNLVGLMGGNVSVRSIVGVGSEFTIDIPLLIDEKILPLPKLNVNLKNMHTLIVDDDLMICEQTQNILNEIGMVGEWVTSGREAIDRVREKFNHEKYYDFIMIDWKMPDMDGIETTQRIRNIVGPDVTIIIISAYDWQSIETEARAAGANMMISKPLLRSNLISAFERAIGEEKTQEIPKIKFDFTGKRILVAEDNDLNAEIARTLLEDKNFEVERVPNGLKVLEKFVQNPPGTYDAILMDVRMPMMDGLQATVNIRHWDRPDAKTIPIVAMTANAFDEDVEKTRAAGMNAHLSKPIEPQLMYSTLQHIMNKND